MATHNKNGQKPIRLSLTMVVRDCAVTLEPLLKAIRPFVDEIIIALGGKSQDATERVARKYADAWFPVKWTWDWASARNETLKHVSGEYWMWLDGDDSIDHPERLADVLRAMDTGIDRVDMVYEYAFDKNGNLLTEHQRERILRTSKQWHWLDRVHETANTDLPHRAAFDDTIKIIHKRVGDENASERNLPILLEMMEADPKPRTLLHLAHAYYSTGKWAEALFYYEQYMEAPENDINHWSAAIMGARTSIEIEDYPKATSWAMVAAGICPQYADAYTLLAVAEWHTNQDVAKAEAWVRQAKESLEAPLAVFRMPLDNLAALWDVEHRILASKKQWAEALHICEHAMETIPDSKQWLAMCQFYRECVFTEKSRQAALQLADHLVRHGDVTRAKGLLENFLPSTIRDDPAIMVAQNRVYDFLNTNGADEYKDADHFFDDWDIELFPRFQWYVERLAAIGARKVLEVGCHNGLIARHLAQRGIECVGVDFNPKVIKIAEERSVGMPNPPRFICGRLEDITEKFDAVLCAEVLEHMQPSEQMRMLQLAENLAPVVLGSVPAEPIGLCAGLFEKSDIGVETFRPHVFEFDQHDLETLILTDPDRRIVNCHKLPHNDHPIPGYGNRMFEFDRAERGNGIGIAFVLGPGFEMWTPNDIEGKGVGGSETAAVRLAEELAKRGHFVTIYGPETGVYNNVVYRHWKQYDPTVAREVVVISRELAPLAERPNAGMVVLWCHDIAYEDGDFTPEIASRVDHIVVLSEWQRDYWANRYPFVADKLRVIGNAIKIYDVSHSERIPHRFIYSSSPDRGLDDLLLRWPLIREMGNAELHVYYGWQYLDAAPHLKGFKRDVLQLAKQDGVFLHGRIGQKQLAEEFAKAQFWLYPSILPRQPNQNSNGQDFHETFCISALEAQAYGCIPVTRDVGALHERLGSQFFVEPWVTGNILQTLKNWDEMGAGKLARVRATMREEAEKYTWKSVADGWLTMIASRLLQPELEVASA